MLGEHEALRDLAHLVAGAADALEPAGDGRRRLHLHDEVDRAHVDAELEARRRHHAAQPAGLEVGLDQGPLLLAHGAVVGTGEHRLGSPGDPGRPDGLGRRSPRRQDAVAGLGRRQEPVARGNGDRLGLPLGPELVEACREPLGEAPRVREHDRGAMREHLVEDGGLDVRPHRSRPRLRGEVGQVVDRHRDPDVEPLAARRRDDAHRPRAGEEARHLLAGSHRGGQPDALHRRRGELLEALEGQGEVGAPLRAGERVDLVDDHGLDAAQGLAGRGGEHEEQRLGRRDEDLGRMRHERAALGGQRVAGPHADAHLGHLESVGRRRAGDADERGAQVALDVDAERLQRREVHHLRARRRGIRPRRVQPVDGPEERRERLARARRGDDQRVLAAGDRLPGLALHARGLGEGLGEPRPGRGRERVQRLGHPPIQPDAADARPGSAFSERPRAPRRAPARRRRRCGAPARHPSASCSPRTGRPRGRASAMSSRAPRPRPRAAR